MTGSIAAIADSIDCDLLVQLLNETLALMDTDRAAARQHIVHARTIILGQPGVEPLQDGALADWQMRRVVAFVHANLATRLRIKQVAEALKMSPSYLSRAFKATTGITYSDFVLRTRIDLAKWLLLTTETPICEIALVCGLYDQAHLTRVFKRATGLPPRAWRRRLGCADNHPLVLGEAAGPEGEEIGGWLDRDPAADQPAAPRIVGDPHSTPKREGIARHGEAGGSINWSDRRGLPTRVGVWLDPHDHGRPLRLSER